MKSFISPCSIAALCGVLPKGCKTPAKRKTSDIIRLTTDKAGRVTASNRLEPADATKKRATKSGRSATH